MRFGEARKTWLGIALLCLATPLFSVDHGSRSAANKSEVSILYNEKLLGASFLPIQNAIANLENPDKEGPNDLTEPLNKLFWNLVDAWKQCQGTCRNLYLGMGVENLEGFLSNFPFSESVKMKEATRRLISIFLNRKLIPSTELQAQLIKLKEKKSKKELEENPLYQEWISRLDNVKEEAEAFGMTEQEYLLRTEEGIQGHGGVVEIFFNNGDSPLKKEELEKALSDALKRKKMRNSLNSNPVSTRSLEAGTEFQERMLDYLKDEAFRAKVSSSESLTSNMKDFVSTLHRIIDITEDENGNVSITKRTGPDAEAALNELQSRWGGNLDEYLRAWNETPLEATEDNPWGVRVPDFSWAILNAIGKQNADGSVSIKTTPEGNSPEAAGSPEGNYETIRSPQSVRDFLDRKSDPSGDRVTPPSQYRLGSPEKSDSQGPKSNSKVADTKPEEKENVPKQTKDKTTAPTKSGLSVGSPSQSHGGNNPVKSQVAGDPVGPARGLAGTGDSSNLSTIPTERPLNEAKELPSRKSNVSLGKPKKIPLRTASIGAPKNIQASSGSSQALKTPFSMEPKSLGNSKPFIPAGIGLASLPSPQAGLLEKEPLMKVLKKPGIPEEVEKAKTAPSKKRPLSDEFAYSEKEKKAARKKEKLKTIELPPTEEFDELNSVYVETLKKKTVGENSKTVFSEEESTVIKTVDKKTVKKTVKKTTYGTEIKSEEISTEFDPKTGKVLKTKAVQKETDQSGKVRSRKVLEAWYSPKNSSVIERTVQIIEDWSTQNPIRSMTTEEFDPQTGKFLKKTTNVESLEAPSKSA